MVFTQELTAKFGKIWAKRPLVRSNGLVCSIANRRHRQNRPRPVFKAVCFSLNGASALRRAVRVCWRGCTAVLAG